MAFFSPLLKQIFRQSLLVVAFSVGLFSCRSSQEITKPDIVAKSEKAINESLLSLYRKAAAFTTAIQTLEGYGSMNIRSPELNQSLNCVVKIKRGEAMQLTGSVFFGITAFDAMVKSDSLFLYSPLEKRLYVGRNSRENLKRITGLSAAFADMLDAFLGLPKLDTTASNLRKAATGQESVAFFLKQDEKLEVVEVNPTTASVQSLRVLDSLERTQGAIFFRNMERIEKNGATVFLPKEIELATYEYQPDGAYQARQIFIRYSERELNSPNFAFTFEPSRRAKIFNIDQMQLKFR